MLGKEGRGGAAQEGMQYRRGRVKVKQVEVHQEDGMGQRSQGAGRLPSVRAADRLHDPAVIRAICMGA